MRRLYTLLLCLALPFVSVVVAWRGLADRRYWQGWSARFGAVPRSSRGGLWVHAVSVGEVQAALALVGALRSAHPARPLWLSSATPAGRTRAREALGSAVAVSYAPYDLPWALRAALRRFRPALLLVVETEIWPNLLAECARAGVPVVFASARVSERSTRRYERFPGLVRTAFGAAVTIAAQSAADAARFVRLGVPAERAVVCGNIKFDRESDPDIGRRGAALRARYAGGRFLWVAGSTHAGEEQAALAAHARLTTRQPALLVLAPRHAPRFDEVAALLRAQGVRFARHSAPTAETAAADVLLLDTIGELSDFYAAADLAFVGGSLVEVGGHNLLEPAQLGVATVSGPHQFNAPDVVLALRENHAVRIVASAAELAEMVSALAGDPAARAALGHAGRVVVAANRGALARVLALVGALLATR
ncbi:MAG: lipid IV(A) 3-deoxy-D-manno-octulosonic acid transferase [Steroidobacteraceae bacterium]